MDLWNADKLTLFIVFFLPGFISMKVYDLLVPGEPRDFTKSMFEAISYSALNFAALFWLIATIRTGDFYHRHFVLYSFSVAVIMIVVRLLAVRIPSDFGMAAFRKAPRPPDSKALGLRLWET